jgi:hypothetical protein
MTMDWKKFISLKIQFNLIVISPTINIGDTANSTVKAVLTVGLAVNW